MLMIGERAQAAALEAKLKQLRLAKHEFYANGHTEETRAKGWIYPVSGVILKERVGSYVDADQDVVDLTLRVGMQQEKVDMLKEIVKSVTNRQWNLRCALDAMKFQMGA